MDYQPIPEGKDPQLWQLANKRASFKSHLATYVVVNAFLWLLWYFTGGKNYDGGIPWPLWCTAGWGIGLVMHFVGAYVSTGYSSVEKEYDKLKNKNN